MMHRLVLPISAYLVIGVALPASGETWSRFSSLVKTSDYIAQYQLLKRGDAVVGRRLVKTYWKKSDFQSRLLSQFETSKEWTLSDYDHQTDTLVTVFVFYGRGQHLWTASPEKGVFLYPGITAHREPGEEIASSMTEFHDVLLKVGKLKTAGEDVKGRLELPVFGKRKTAL